MPARRSVWSGKRGWPRQHLGSTRVKVALVNPPQQQRGGRSDRADLPDIGIGHLAGTLRAQGVSVSVLDAKLERIGYVYFFLRNGRLADFLRFRWQNRVEGGRSCAALSRSFWHAQRRASRVMHR
jgi:hypothetical protein